MKRLALYGAKIGGEMNHLATYSLEDDLNRAFEYWMNQGYEDFEIAVISY